MRLTAIFLALLLGACTTTQQIVKVPVEVKVPVTVKCKVKYPEEPPKLEAPQGLYDQGKQLIQDNVAYRSYAKELRVALVACSEQE